MIVDDSGAGLLQEAVVAELEQLDGDVLRDLVALYFDEADGHVTALSGAIGRGETLSVGQTAHKLGGGSRTLGAAYVAQIASELEATARAGDLTGADELLDRLRSGLDETRLAFRSRAAAKTDRVASRTR